MSRLTQDATADSVSRDQVISREWGQGNVNFPCSADHEQDWQPYLVDSYSAICDAHTYIPGTKLEAPVRAERTKIQASYVIMLGLLSGSTFGESKSIVGYTVT